jgi:hypothetical protein
MRWALRVVVFLVLAGVGAAAVYGLSQFSPTQVTQLPANLRPPPEQAPYVPPPPVGAQWRYSIPERGAEQACVKTTADVSLGGAAQSAVLLCLRHGGGYPAIVSIALADHSGRFACGECELQARLDGARQGLSGSTASSDGTAFTIFLKDPAGFTASVKRASTLTVTLPVRGAGDQTASFDVAGLKWTG